MRVTFLLLLLLVPFVTKPQGQEAFSSLPHNNPLATPLDSSVHIAAKDFFEKSDAPGMVLSVFRNGRTQYYCYGYADKEQKQLFTDTTLLEIGSITKTFTAAILLRLQQDGMLSIDSSLAGFFPEAGKENNSLQHITLRQLLNHSGGIPRLPENLDKVRNYSFLQPYEHYTRDNLLSFLKEIRPGTAGKYDYSNLGFGILGTIAETRSGKDYGTLLETYVFAPLGMRRSSTTGNDVLSPKARGYMENEPVAYWQFGSLAGAGAIKSTSEDMTRYLQACLGQTSDKNLSSAISQAIQPSLKISEGLSIGMAWHIMTGRTPPVYWHNGGTYGFSTFAAFEPKSQTAIFAAANAFNVNSALEAFSGKILISITEIK